MKSTVIFSCDAESDPFISALSSVMLYTVDPEEPVWCNPNNRYCNNCGGCGEKTMPERRQLQLYHALLAATGIAFGFRYPEDDAACAPALSGWRWPDEFLGYVMDFAGLAWKRYGVNTDKDEVADAIAASAMPVLVRLGGKNNFGAGTVWQIVTGYEKGALIGLDGGSLSDRCEYANGFFRDEHWAEHFLDAVVITGTKERGVSYSEILKRVGSVLSDPSRDLLEEELNRRLSRINEANAEQTALFLKSVADVPIEARWHGAEAFISRDNLISRLTEDEELKRELADLFFETYIMDGVGGTHEACWKIWTLLGVGSESGYEIAAAKSLLNPQIAAEIKALFQLVFDNDRKVLSKLKKLI